MCHGTINRIEHKTMQYYTLRCNTPRCNLREDNALCYNNNTQGNAVQTKRYNTSTINTGLCGIMQDDASIRCYNVNVVYDTIHFNKISIQWNTV